MAGDVALRGSRSVDGRYHARISTTCGPSRRSASITRPGNLGAAFDAAVETLPTLMGRLGHDRIDVLKMDIEGAEGPCSMH
jgi:hypothetical protein